MAIKVSLKGVPTGVESVRDLGVYTATFTSAKGTESKSTPGAVNVGLRFTASSPDEYSGKSLFVNHSTSEGGLPWLKRTLIRMGASPDELEQDNMDLEPIFKDLENTEHYLRITAAEGEYNGRPNVNVEVMDPELAERELAAPAPAAQAKAKSK